jgi:translation initiation factor IF-2
VGTVIESAIEKGRGYVTKVLIQNGTLDKGDPIIAGEYSPVVLKPCSTTAVKR